MEDGSDYTSGAEADITELKAMKSVKFFQI
jgi:hypothetical protein